MASYAYLQYTSLLTQKIPFLEQNIHQIGNFVPIFCLHKKPNPKSTLLVLFAFQIKGELIELISGLAMVVGIKWGQKQDFPSFFCRHFFVNHHEDMIGINTHVFESFGAKRSQYGNDIFHFEEVPIYIIYY